MDIRVLGPFEVVAAEGTAPLPLGGPQQRAVLAVLALRAGRLVPATTLVEALWPGDAPVSALGVVHTYVSRLRRAIPDEARLVRQAQGYVLEVAPDSVDAHRFECLVAEARGHAGGTAAADAYRAALALWRGEVLADLPGLVAVEHDVSHLDQLRMAAQEERVDVELARGGHVDVVPELTRLVERHPYHERFWAQLMLALYRGGRQTEALAAYRRVRTLLVDEFGIEPGPELQALESDVLRHAATIAAPDGARVEPARATSSEPVPLPAALAHPAHDRPLAGRERERAVLGEAFDVARAGHFAAVFVGGPPGIGKTALAAWFARQAHAAGATVVMGRADEASPTPFRPLGEAIGHWAQHRLRDGDERRRLDEDDLDLLARIVPRLRSRGSAGDDHDRLRLFDATGRWVEELAAEAAAEGAPPPVVLLDDLQWADVATLLAVRHLLRHPPGAGALLLVTHRDVDLADGVDAGQGLLDLLAGVPGDGPARRLVLPGLGPDAVVAMLDTHSAATPELAQELVRVTGGNPLFVHETVRYLGERGGLAEGIDPTTGRLRLDDVGVPDGVKEVIERRLRRLPDATTAVLRRAAVLGERVDRPVLARLADRPELELVEALEPALAARLLVADGDVLSFAHALVREAIVDGLGLAERARTHWRAGHLLSELGEQRPEADLAGIAHHLTAGVSAGETTATVDANVRAGEAALPSLAFEEALYHFETATELLATGDKTDSDLTFRAWHGLGMAAGVLADRGRQRQGYLRAAEVARANGWAEALTNAVTGFVAYVGTAGSGGAAVETADHQHDEAVAATLLHDALAIVGDEPSYERCTLLAIAAVRAVTVDHTEEARAAADEALAGARRLDIPYVLAHAQVTYMWSRLGSPAGLDFDDAPHRVLGFDLPPETRIALRVFTLPVLPAAAVQRGDRRGYEAVRAEVAADPETWRSAHLQSYLRMWDGAMALADGRFGEALRLASTPAPGAEGWGMWASAGVVQRVIASAEIGDPTTGPRVEMFLTMTPSPKPPVGLALAADLAAAAGDSDRAHQHIHRLRAQQPFDRMGWGAPLALRHLAEAAARLEDAALAAELLPVARGYDGQMLSSFTTTTVDGAGARVVGLLLLAAGQPGEAVDRLRAALDLERAFRAPALAARSAYWLARAHLARDDTGDRDAARQVAEEALPVTDRLGMSLLGRDLRVLLQQLSG